MKPTQDESMELARKTGFGEFFIKHNSFRLKQLATLAFAAGQASKVPEGWKMVPVVPTFEMAEAVEIKDDQGNWIQVETCSDIYRAMIAAVPSQEGGES